MQLRARHAGLILSTVLELEPRPIRVDEYHRMIAAGILTEDIKVELIDGRSTARVHRVGATHS